MIELGKLFYIIPNLSIRYTKDNIIYYLSITITAYMIPFFYNEATLATALRFMSKYSIKQACSNQ